MKHIHFMGIAGSGMSAVASIAKSFGYEVSGCDLNPDSDYIKNLRREVPMFKNHSLSHLENVDILTISPAITSLNSQNPELLEAKKKKIPVLTWQEFMGRFLQKDKFVIAVAGTHGKSTTTAMIGLILENAGLDPTVEVGAIVPEWGSNFRVGRSKYFVCEADEFNDNFLNYHPDIAVITNIEMDHPEYFKDLRAVKKTFNKFIKNIKKGGTLINQIQIKPGLNLKIPGLFNLQNASLAASVAQRLGIKEKIIQNTLNNFQGVGRRFEFKGEYQGVRVYDDYAHHPTAIRATLKAAREKFPQNKIWLVFQPHMFSRTKYLFDEFVSAFQNIPSDENIILDIFPSREKDTGLVSSNDLVLAINRSNVTYLGKIEEAADLLKSNLKKDDILINMGAGNINKLSQILLEKHD